MYRIVLFERVGERSGTYFKVKYLLIDIDVFIEKIRFHMRGEGLMHHLLYHEPNHEKSALSRVQRHTAYKNMLMEACLFTLCIMRLMI